MPNIIDFGYEPKSEYCEGCISHDYNETKNKEICHVFSSYLYALNLKVEPWNFLRCQACKDTEVKNGK